MKIFCGLVRGIFWSFVGLRLFVSKVMGCKWNLEGNGVCVFGICRLDCFFLIFRRSEVRLMVNAGFRVEIKGIL